MVSENSYYKFRFSFVIADEIFFRTQFLNSIITDSQFPHCFLDILFPRLPRRKVTKNPYALRTLVNLRISTTMWHLTLGKLFFLIFSPGFFPSRVSSNYFYFFKLWHIIKMEFIHQFFCFSPPHLPVNFLNVIIRLNICDDQFVLFLWRNSFIITLTRKENEGNLSITR